MKRWLITIVVFLGAGAGFGNLDNLQDGVLPVVAQIATLVAVGLLALIKAAPDVDADDVPDAVQGTWVGRLLKWLVPILFGVAAAGGVTLASGCAAVADAAKAPPLVWTGASLAMEAAPDDLAGRAGVDLEVFGVPVNVTVQGSTASRVAGACAQVDGLPAVCVKYDGAVTFGGIIRPVPTRGKGTMLDLGERVSLRSSSKRWLRSLPRGGFMAVGP